MTVTRGVELWYWHTNSMWYWRTVSTDAELSMAHCVNSCLMSMHASMFYVSLFLHEMWT